MSQPQVTVICTVYNHARFVEQALRSVMDQSYPFVQLIVVDNCSDDGSAEIIERLLKERPDIRFHRNTYNKGLCRAFNEALAFSSGKYVVDFSADDVMHPERIEMQVALFESLPENYGVIYSNASLIDWNGNWLGDHYPVNRFGEAIGSIPQGDIYPDILRQYFICTPTMMIRKAVFDALNGYDGDLEFEDFDFWVRSATVFKYWYQDEITTLRRVLPDSLSQQVVEKESRILESTYKVCCKAYDLNRNQAEFDILARRIRSFIRKCFYAEQFDLAIKFRNLLNYIEDPGVATNIIIMLCKLRIPINRVYRFYIRDIKRKSRTYFKVTVAN